MKKFFVLAALLVATTAQAAVPTSVKSDALTVLTQQHHLTATQQAAVKPLLAAYLTERAELVAATAHVPADLQQTVLLRLYTAFQAKVHALKKSE